ncbi:MAG: T9SS type A sorting domain-containing protein [Bacteroidetes bacterium]|nr:T9SS type A sorting domain-containing protein [Bacteroidota bacterium]
MKKNLLVGNKNFQYFTLITALLLFPFLKGITQVSLTNLGAAYTQNFDGLANTNTSTAVPSGWALSETGTGANSNYTAGTGSGNSGDTYSFGAASNGERAFGTLRSGSVGSTIGASFTNNTGSIITSLDVSYIGEEWRLGVAGRTDQLNFEYSLNATSLTSGTWNSVAALNFITPNTVAPVNAKDGNLTANRTSLSSTIGSLSIAVGGTVWIRWTDSDISGSEDGLGIDDFSLTPNGTAPTPPTKLVITSINPSSPLAGSAFSVTVQSQDGNSIAQNVITNTAFSLSTNGNAGSIGGTITGTINAGSNSVIVSGVTLATAGTNVDITATRTSGDALSAATSATFDVIGVATQLAFIGTPALGFQSTDMASFKVEARRADNSVDNNYTGAIIISKATGPGSLSGTTSVNAVSGVATFTALQFNQTGVYTLNATSTPLTPGTSSSINISSNPVTWDFTSGSANASGIPSGLSVSALSQGNNNGTTTLVNGTSASSGYPGASGTNNAGAAARTGALNTATNGSAYFEFTLTPAANNIVTLKGLTFGSRSTGTGPQAFSIRSSADNYSSTLSTTSISTGAWILSSPSFSATSSGVASPITFRIYGHNGVGSPGVNTANWRIDDILLDLAVQPCTQPVINVNSGSIISGDSFTITPTGSALTYTFSAGSSIVSPTVTTTYTVTGTSPEGCINSIGAISTVSVMPSIPLTQLTTIWCNSTITTLDANTRPRCVPVINAIDYEWEFTDVSTGNVVFTKQRGAQWADFYLTGYWPNVQYNKTYSVKVRAKVGSTWGNYGTACMLTTPTASLVPTQLTSSYCNTTLSSFNNSTIIRCVPVTGSTDYEYQFTDAITNAVFTKKRSAQWTDLYIKTVSPALVSGKTYSVAVRAYVNNTWGTFGTSCTITIPTPSARFALSDYEETEIGTSINVNAYPNPTTEILNIDFDNMPADASIEIYNMVGELVLSQPLTDMNNTVNTSLLANGLYHAKVIGNNKLLYAQKIVKQ